MKDFDNFELGFEDLYLVILSDGLMMNKVEKVLGVFYFFDFTISAMCYKFGSVWMDQ